jgi:hypothetical protein
VGLLGIPSRIPAVGYVYVMPPVYYDSSDRKGHPVLVARLDPVVREAMILTRTTKAYARGDRAVAHQPHPGLKLSEFGWWRVQYPRYVSYPVFAEADVELCGELDQETWTKVLSSLEGGSR